MVGKAAMKQFALIVGLMAGLTLLTALSSESQSQESLNTALFAALRNNDAALALSLLKRGADVDAGNNGNHLLHGREPPNKENTCPTPLLEIFAWHKPSVPLNAPEGRMPENLLLLKTMLRKGANVNVQDKYGLTPLMLACLVKYSRSARLLVDHGADIQARDIGGATALIYAARSGNYQSVRFLIGRGADVNAKDNDGRTALVEAAEYPDERSIRFLVEKGADVHVRGKFGMTVLIAAEDNHLNSKIIRLLVNKRVEVNARDGRHYTALWLAVGEYQADTVGFLLDHGADVNAQDKNGDNVLMRAVQCNDIVSARLLLARGADVNVRDHQGKTALDYAEKNVPIATLLKQAGAKE